MTSAPSYCIDGEVRTSGGAQASELTITEQLPLIFRSSLTPVTTALSEPIGLVPFGLIRPRSLAGRGQSQAEAGRASQVHLERDARHSFVHDRGPEHLAAAGLDGSDHVAAARIRVVAEIVAVHA